MRLAMSCGRAVVILHAFRQRRGEAGSVESAEPLRDLLSFREPRDAVSAAIRRAQIDALIRLVPVTVTSQLLAAVLVGLIATIAVGGWATDQTCSKAAYPPSQLLVAWTIWMPGLSSARP